MLQRVAMDFITSKMISHPLINHETKPLYIVDLEPHIRVDLVSINESTNMTHMMFEERKFLVYGSYILIENGFSG